MMTKLYMSLGVAAAVVLGLFYAYFEYSQSKLATLNKLVSEQAVQIEGFKAVVEDLKADAVRIRKITDEINTNLSKIRLEAANQRKAIDSHNLGVIGARKPALLQDRVNRATRDRFQNLEEISK